MIHSRGARCQAKTGQARGGGGDGRARDLEGGDTGRTRTAPIPILALTAYPEDHAAEALIESGCADYLTKPVTWDILLEALRHYLPGA